MPEKICNRKIAYRPFDFRFTYYTGKTRGFIGTPGRKIGVQFAKPNYGLILSRTVYGEADWQDVQVTDCIVEFGIMATRVGNTAPVFPLYLYAEATKQGDLIETGSAKRKPNLNGEIVAEIAARLNLAFIADHEDKTLSDHSRFSPLDLLDYIYAMLHSPTYRSTYREFLKIKFPRIPFPTNADNFWQLVQLGSDLRNLHLLKQTLVKPITTYPVSGNNTVEKVLYVDDRVYINKEQVLRQRATRGLGVLHRRIPTRSEVAEGSQRPHPDLGRPAPLRKNCHRPCGDR